MGGLAERSLRVELGVVWGDLASLAASQSDQFICAGAFARDFAFESRELEISEFPVEEFDDDSPRERRDFLSDMAETS